MGKSAKKYFPSNDRGYKDIHLSVVHELGDKPVIESIWLLMTKKAFDSSQYKSYSKQKNALAKISQLTGISYQISSTLEAATCILAEYSRCKNHLFKPNQLQVFSLRERTIPIEPQKDLSKDYENLIKIRKYLLENRKNLIERQETLTKNPNYFDNEFFIKNPKLLYRGYLFYLFNQKQVQNTTYELVLNSIKSQIRVNQLKILGNKEKINNTEETRNLFCYIACQDKINGIETIVGC